MNNLLVNRKQHILEVQLNRPEKRNAFHPEMIEELTAVFKDLGDARVVLLKGQGRSFCAGADLDWMKDMKSYSLEENRKDSEKLYRMFAALRDCPIPVVGHVQGHVMGGALGLLALCDIAAAEDGTQFCFSEVKLGLVPAVISPFVVSKVFSGRVRRWMLTAEAFSAHEALEEGLVNYVGDEIGVQNFVGEILERFKFLGPEAVKDTKYLLRGLPVWDEQKIFQETTRVIAERRVSPEGQEGLSSFFEKRDPGFKLK